MTPDWTSLTDIQIAQLWLDDSRAGRKESVGISSLLDLTYHAPNRAWNVTLEILERLGDDEQLLIASIGAGPIEDLLNRHGADYIDRVIEHARRDRRFRAAASCVWPSGIGEAHWQRLQAVVLPFGTAPLKR